MSKGIYFPLRISLFLITLFTFSHCGNQGGKEKSSSADSTKANVKLNEDSLRLVHEYDKSIGEITKKILLEDIHNPLLYFERAKLYWAKGDPVAARKDINQAIRLDPKNPDYYYERALFEDAEANPDSALHDYLRALALGITDSAHVHIQLGLIYLYDKMNIAAAEKFFQQAIKINLKYALAYYYLGICYAQENKLRDAKIALQKSMKYDEKYFLTYIALGRIAETERKFDEAKVYYDKSLEITESDEGYYSRGSLHYEMNKPEDAVADYTKCISINPYNLKAYYDRGIAYYDLKNYALAREDFSKVVSQDRFNEKAFYMRGACYEALGDKENAFNDFKRAYELNPSYDLAKQAYQELKAELKK